MRVPNRSSRGKVALAAAAGAGLVVAPLSFITPAAQAADPVDITVIGTNDFHGRLLPDRDIPGAAKYAGAVDALRAENPNTIFAAAGDLIGATTFESFINQDKPTIDVLNEMGLDVSAVGNHELDGGWDDLTKRVMAPESEANQKGGALWEYIAANLVGPAGEEDLIEDSWTTEVGGVTVGFVGAVTEDLPSLVSPAGIEGVQVTDIVDATNAEADRLVAEENADLVVLLVHEGSPGTDCAVVGSPDNAFGQIVTGLNANVDAVVSGHTHLSYSCEFPVAGKVAPRPVVSAGQYGAFLSKVDFSVEPETGEVLGVSMEQVNVNTGEFAPDPEVQEIVDQAVAAAEEPGSVVLGELGDDARRAVQPADEGTTAENRGGESVLGNLVAEVQRWATRSDSRGGAQIAFMNPGGLRADMEAGDLTYKEAAVVQPFANTLVNMDMTGAQIKALLEQQWQPEGASRPFLRLGTSRGFEFTYDPEGAPGERITGIFLKNKPLDPSATYSVTANSFLAGGGDNFGAFLEATDKRDTGVTDLQGMVDYMAAKTAGSPLDPRANQHAVGVQASKAKVARGGKVVMDLSSLVMTAEGDPQDKMVRVKLGKKVRGKAPVDPTLIAGGFDESGTATVTVKIPKKAKPGMRYVRIVGNQTGTSVKVPLRITKK